MPMFITTVLFRPSCVVAFSLLSRDSWFRKVAISVKNGGKTEYESNKSSGKLTCCWDAAVQWVTKILTIGWEKKKLKTEESYVDTRN